MSDPGSPAFGAGLARDIVRRELDRARNLLALVGLVAIAVQLVALNDVHHKLAALEGMAYDHSVVRTFELAAYANIAVGVAYLVCAFLVARKPVVATVTGLILFLATVLAAAVIDPAPLLSLGGFGTRLCLLIALVSAVTFARTYERNRATLGDAFAKPTPAEHRHNRRVMAMIAAAVVVASVAVVLYMRSRGGAPGGKVRDRRDHSVELSTLWGEKRTLVLFYAGFDREREQLAEVNAHLAELDAKVIAISFDSTSRMEQLHEELELGFELYTDRTFQVMSKWGVPFVMADATSAATFVVEPDGSISHKQIGEHPPIAELVKLTHR